MKKWMVVLGIVAVMAVVARAAPVDEASFYRAGELSIDTFGLVRTSDFDQERTGAGLGVNFFPYRQFGLGLEGFSGDMNGVFVDHARLNLIYRIPIGKSAPYFFLGGGRSFDEQADDNRRSGWRGERGRVDSGNSEEWAVNVGVGLEHRLNPKFGAFIDVRMDKVLDHPATALARVGIRVSF